MCNKSITELQNLANLSLSSFAESQLMQRKNFVISPKYIGDGQSSANTFKKCIFLLVYKLFEMVPKQNLLCCLPQRDRNTLGRIWD